MVQIAVIKLSIFRANRCGCQRAGARIRSFDAAIEVKKAAAKNLYT